MPLFFIYITCYHRAVNPLTYPSKIRKHIPHYLFDFAQRFTVAGYQAVLVGGAVRDIVMGSVPDDFDFASSARPDQVKQIFTRVIPTGIQHGTVTVPFHGKLIEVTTFRIDGNYSDSRRPDSVKFSTKLSEDLSRRDFTINALAINLPDCKLIDQTDGVHDITSKIIRAIGDPHARFTEDALRIIRGLRFASRLGFHVDPETFSAMKSCSHLLNQVAAERLRTEWIKLLAGAHPDPAISKLLQLNQEHLFLPIKRTIQTGLLNSIPQISNFTTCSKGQELWQWRLSILSCHLLSDSIPLDEKSIHQSFLDKRYTKYESCALSKIILSLHHPIPHNDTASIRRYLFAVSPYRWSDISQARQILGLGLPEQEVQRKIIEEEQAGVIRSTQELHIDGATIMKLLDKKPGPWLGVLLNRILEHIVLHPEDNTVDQLETLAIKLVGDQK